LFTNRLNNSNLFNEFVCKLGFFWLTHAKKKTIYTRTSWSLRLAYFALVHCPIDYGILIWGHTGTLYRIFRLQRRAVRVIANLGFRDDCREHFAKLKIIWNMLLIIRNCTLNYHLIINTVLGLKTLITYFYV
jgi:hypothetical protein